MGKKHLAAISILIKDRKKNAPEVNQILTEHGHLVLARLGVNLQRHCIEHCTALITVVVEGELEEIKNVTRALDEIYGIVAKTSVLTE
jgi:putative iron-only hydrogenase system regulator